MKHIVFSIFMFGTIQLSHAQYGMNAQFSSGHLTAIEMDDIADTEIMTTGSGYHVGVNYWLRLKNVRLEFFPEIAYSQLDARRLGQIPEFTMQRWSLTLPASFYLLDFRGDCHCPTFSKQNDLVKKGLFLQVLASLEHEKGTYDSPLDSKWHQNIGAGVGTGLDIGVSDLVTITPLVQYLHTLYSTKEDVRPGTSNSWRAGIRVLFRPDYR